MTVAQLDKQIVCIPCRGVAERVTGLSHHGCKLLIDVAGKSAIERQLDVITHSDVHICTLPQYVDEVQAVVGGRARVYGRDVVEHDGPMVTLNMMIEDLTYGVGVKPDTPVTFLFADTLLLPGANWRRLTEDNTVIVQPVDDGSRFLNVQVNDYDQVHTWIDHPHDGKPALATVGIYTLTLEDWRFVFQNPVAPNDFSLMHCAPFRAVFTSDWLDVGTPESYKRTIRTLKGLGA